MNYRIEKDTMGEVKCLPINIGALKQKDPEIILRLGQKPQCRLK